MKKILLSTVLFSTLVFSEQIRIIPIDKSLLAQENGGNKPAIDAYSDGIGIVTESKQNIDNSPMNTLVYQYGEKAKNEGLSLKNYILNNVDESNNKNLANDLGKLGELNNDIEGTSCNDNNSLTINDKYVNGVCVGINVEGQSCNDNDSYTINDKYVSGVCVGTSLEGTSCNDNNSLTINDKYINGTCIGTSIIGTSCNDNNSLTINDVYNSNGVCVGTNVEGQSCNDNNAQTINDKYVNGVCVGTNVEGQSCNDNNAQTINDKYVSGICIGTNVEGQSCNDNNAQTINDKYVNGVCVGTFNGIAESCLQLYNAGIRTDGTYTLDVDGTSGPIASSSYTCDMANGGWTILTNILYNGTATYPENTRGTFSYGMLNTSNSTNLEKYKALSKRSSQMSIYMAYTGSNVDFQLRDGDFNSVLYTTNTFSKKWFSFNLNHNYPNDYIYYFQAVRPLSYSATNPVTNVFTIYSTSAKFR